MQCRPSICIWGYSWRRDVCLYELLLFHLLIKKKHFPRHEIEDEYLSDENVRCTRIPAESQNFTEKTLMCYLVLRRIYSTTIFVLINILKETCNHNHILEYSYIQYSNFIYIILHVINETCARKLVYSQDLTRMPWYLQRHWLGRCICQCNRFRPFACKTNN